MFGGCPVMHTTTIRIMDARQRKKARPNKTPSAPSALGHACHPDAAGIDIGAEELVVAVPHGRCEGPSVRTFSAFTEGLPALRDWLLSCKIKTVAMESTGNYWLCACAGLEDAGIEVCRVDARHVKGVPGKKTDVIDAAWLQQLHAAGLLRVSFRPRREILPLRYLMRHRGDLVAQAGQQVQLMQKVLTEMNLHIQHVFSDVSARSALGSARVPRAESGVAPDSRSTTISPAERESGERGLRRDAEAGTPGNSLPSPTSRTKSPRSPPTNPLRAGWDSTRTTASAADAS